MKSAAQETPRAQRFPVSLRVLCRPAGGKTWTEGVTRNASRSGVLFQCPRPLAIGTAVELILGLSLAGVTPPETADMLCEGYIVRAHADVTEDDTATLAATIARYSYLRASSGKRV